MTVKRTHSAFLTLALATLPILSLEAQSSRDLQEQANGVLSKYRQAVTTGAPQATVQALYAEYQKIKNLVPVGKSGEPLEELSVAAEQLIPFSGPILQDSSKGVGADEKVAKLVEALYAPGAYTPPNEVLTQAEKYLEQHPANPDKNRLTYEIALAYERLKKNPTRSRELLARLAASPELKGSKAPTDALLLKKTLFRLGLVEKRGALAVQGAKVEACRQKLGASTTKLAGTSPWNVAMVAWHKVAIARHSGTYYKEVNRYNDLRNQVQLAIEESPLNDRLSLEQVYYGLKAEEGLHTSRVRLVTDNSEAWNIRWHLLNQARESIDLTYFIVEDHVFGKSVLGKLVEKAKQGVRIRLMMDARGSMKIKGLTEIDYLQELAEFPNVQVKVYNPIHKGLYKLFSDIKSLLACTHQKIFIIDGHTAVTGGRNLGTVDYVEMGDLDYVNRDTDVLLEGEYICDAMKRAFDHEFGTLRNKEVTRDRLGDWRDRLPELLLTARLMDTFLATGKVPVPRDPAQRKLVQNHIAELQKYKQLFHPDFVLWPESREIPCKFLSKSAQLDVRNEITDNIIALMDACEDEILMQNPYVVLTPRIRAAIVRAAKRGVRVTLHTNSPVSNNQLLAQAMFHSDWKQLEKDAPGLRLFGFKDRILLHAKTFVFDKRVSVVGTYNLDYLSDQINGECVTVFLCPEFAEENRQAILFDINRSLEYRIEVLPDGDIRVLSGPEDHPNIEKILKKIEWMQKLQFLRELI